MNIKHAKAIHETIGEFLPDHPDLADVDDVHTYMPYETYAADGECTSIERTVDIDGLRYLVTVKEAPR